MKIQRIIHGLVFVTHLSGLYVAWKYLPPYLLHNPGLQAMATALVVGDLLHCICHGK